VARARLGALLVSGDPATTMHDITIPQIIRNAITATSLA
jgi:hypothetical protein